MERTIALLGAPSNIGIRPYDDGRPRGLDRAPAALRGRKACGPARRRRRRRRRAASVRRFHTSGRPRPERGSHRPLFERHRRAGGACPVGRAFRSPPRRRLQHRLGRLVRRTEASNSRLGLVYVDGHADFATPEESVTGSAAAMCAAFAIGRGDSALAQLAEMPLVNGSDLAILGRRDDSYGDIYGQAALRAAGALDIPAPAVRSRGVAAAAAAALERLSGVSRIWIHVDADVLDPSVMPAVDSPEPSGVLVDELVSLVRPFVRDPRAVGLQLTIYDPNLDSDGTCAETLVSVLEQTFAGRSE